MKRITVFILLALCITQTASAQTGTRIFGAQQFVLDDNTFANPKIYLSQTNGSMGIDQSGIVNGTFPNSNSLMTLLAGSKPTTLRIDGGSTWGIDIQNTNNSLRTTGRNIFGDGAGVDDAIFNIAGGNIIFNTLPSPALPGPLVNFTYMNGLNQLTMTPSGINIVSGSGTVNTIPLWTPTGFQIGNSILTQPTTSTMVITPTAGGTNVLTINNGSNTSTALKINANGGTAINIDPASIGMKIDATTTGIDVGTGATKPTTGIIIRPTTTGMNVIGSSATSAGINIDMNTVAAPNGALGFFSNVRGQNSDPIGIVAVQGVVTADNATGNSGSFGATTTANGGKVTGVIGIANMQGNNSTAAGVAGIVSSSNANGGIIAAGVFDASASTAVNTLIKGITVSAQGSATSGATLGESINATTSAPNPNPVTGLTISSSGSSTANTGIQVTTNGAGSVGVDITNAQTGVNIIGSSISVNADGLVKTTGNLIIGGTSTLGTGSTPIQQVISQNANLGALNIPAVGGGTFILGLGGVTGAALGDPVFIGMDNAIMATGNITYSAWVSAPNTVSIALQNASAFPIAIPAGTKIRVAVMKF